MLQKLIIALFFVVLVHGSSAQEFLCKVQVEARQIAGVDPSVFDALEKTVFEFMNNRSWSGLNLKIEERIECMMLFTIEGAEQGGDKFSGKLNVVLQRPIYGTDYNSVVINLVDKDIQFTYTPYQGMEYADNVFNDNLTQILAYYAYLMLGLDMDTYSRYGGTIFYQKAQVVAQTAQNSNYKGWQLFEGPKNRYQLVENLLNTSYNDLRSMIYEYHRLGLDIMLEDNQNGRKAITKSLGYLKAVYDKRPNIYSLQVMIEAKRQEIISIYGEATPAEKVAMINIMSAIDPPNGNKYEAVNK